MGRSFRVLCGMFTILTSALFFLDKYSPIFQGIPHWGFAALAFTFLIWMNVIFISCSPSDLSEANSARDDAFRKMKIYRHIAEKVAEKEINLDEIED